MNELQVFKNDLFCELRTVMRYGKPWFSSTDVCRALGIGRPAVWKINIDEKGLHSTQTLAGDRHYVEIVNEYGLYALILGSCKPEARAYLYWIIHDVLPAIGKL